MLGELGADAEAAAPLCMNFIVSSLLEAPVGVCDAIVLDVTVPLGELVGQVYGVNDSGRASKAVLQLGELALAKIRERVFVDWCGSAYRK